MSKRRNNLLRNAQQEIALHGKFPEESIDQSGIEF
jgi:hypothetical protein